MKGSKSQSSSDPYLRALNLLTRRDHTVAELKQKLAIRGFSAAAVAEAVAKLVEQGLLDDRRFAERWSEAAISSGRGYGVRIFQELQRKGVARDIAAAAVAGAAAEHSEVESLNSIVSRRFSTFDPADVSPKEKQRVYSYLLRRGFSLQTISGFFINRKEEFDR